MRNGAIVIVGAGPAGVEAALTLVEAGLSPIVIDAAARSGGQIYRRPPDTHTRQYKAIYGADAADAQELHARFDAILDKIDYRPNTRVWAAHETSLFLDGPNGQEIVPFKKLVLCTGAIDRVYPIMGWEATGCYSLGGSQIALKSQALALGDPIGFVGAGPLLWLVAWQHMKSGTTVAGVWCTSSWKNLLKAAPFLALRPALALRGLGQIVGLWRAGVLIKFGTRPLAVKSDAAGQVTGFAWKTRGEARETAMKALALGWHLRSEIQLSQIVNVPTLPGKNHPSVDATGRSAVAGIYMAGDGVEVLGADAARTSGWIAAQSVLEDIHSSLRLSDRIRYVFARLRLARLRGFAKGLGYAFPPLEEGYFNALPEETIICRCEAVRVSAVEATIGDWNTTDLNRIKALTRAGMGRCQGRYCNEALTSFVLARTGCPRAQIAPQRPQTPLYPLAFTKRRDAGPCRTKSN